MLYFRAGTSADVSAHHGIYFAQPKQPNKNKSHQPLPEDIEPKKTEPRPLVCLGYVFDKSVVYMGDVSGIPNTTWEMLESLRPKQKAVRDGKTDNLRSTATRPLGNGSARTSLEATLTDSVLAMDLSSPHHKNGTNGLSNGSGNANGNGGTFTPTPQLPLILIIDALWPIKTHTSHYNFPQALLAAHRLGANMTYLLGFSHPTTHFQWEELCLSIRGLDGRREHPDEGISKRLVEDVWADQQFTKSVGDGKEGPLGENLKRWGGRVEPAWDGLKLQISKEGWTEVETRAAMFH